VKKAALYTKKQRGCEKSRNLVKKVEIFTKKQHRSEKSGNFRKKVERQNLG